MENYAYTTLGTLAALVVYFWSMTRVGSARGKTGVKAPATTGHPDFERAFRAHQNTLEQLAMFLPLAVIVAAMFGDLWGGIYAAVWVVGRTLYVIAYSTAAEKRGPGFMISGVATLAALGGSIVGAVMNLVA